MFLSETSVVDPIFNLVSWVIIMPAIGLLINMVIGKRLGEKGTGIVACTATALSFAVSVMLAVALSRHHGAAVAIQLAEWISVGSFDLNWALRVDTLSVTMMLFVSGVGTLIHIYATGYMHSDVRHNGDPGRYQKFFIFFNLFIVAMMLLVSANNYLVLFVGWEGVGLCSYLLIGFWFEKGEGGIANAKAGKKAFVVNRIGDFGLLIAMFMLFWFFGTLSFDAVFEKAPEIAAAFPAAVMAITLFMLLGVTGKSAQLPLYLWLPDAMAGPTPVSALIHAATMVTAGVYLVARSAPLYVLAPTSQAIVMWVGALTALFAAGVAVAQFDIKRVLAFSTISQLGYMVAAVGMGAFVAGMFHMVTHAFFKALLFLSAGSVIQGIERGQGTLHGGHHEDEHEEENSAEQDVYAFDPQDMRNMGGLQRRMPVTFWVYLIGALALAGIAPLAGFFSKDEILAAANRTSFAVYVILALGAFLTAFYMGRQIFMVFFGKPRSEAAGQATESSLIVTVPLIILAALSLLGGGLNLPGVHTLGHWLEHTIEHAEAGEFVLWIAALSLAVALFGIFLSWLIYGKRQTRATDADPLEKKIGPLFGGWLRHWWLEDAYNWLIVKPYGPNVYGSFAELSAGFLDLKIIDNLSGGLAALTRLLARGLSRYQSGFVRSYAFSILLGVVMILTYLVTR
jgi:NADH-quinone oxidoreductase subunit L